MYKVEQGSFLTFSHNVNVALQHDLMFDLPGTKTGLYNFSPLSHMDENMGAYWASRLIQGHKKLGRQVIIEVGHHGRLSPFETAQRFPDATIIGIEPASVEWSEEKIAPFFEKGQNSVVAMFQFIAEKLQSKGLEVDRVQIVAPDPWHEEKILESVCSLVEVHGQIVMAIDPWAVKTYYSDNLENMPEKIAERFTQLHSQFETHIEYLTQEQIEEKFGFKDSKYLGKADFPLIPVLLATRKE